MSKKILFILLYVLFIFSFATASGQAKIKLAMTEFKPYTYLEDNELKGFGYEIISNILNDMNYDFDIVLIENYDRAILETKVGRVDGVFLSEAVFDEALKNHNFNKKTIKRISFRLEYISPKNIIMNTLNFSLNSITELKNLNLKTNKTSLYK